MWSYLKTGKIHRLGILRDSLIVLQDLLGPSWVMYSGSGLKFSIWFIYIFGKVTVTKFLGELHTTTWTHGNWAKVLIARKESLIQYPVTSGVTLHSLFLVISPRNSINSCAVSSSEDCDHKAPGCCVTTLTHSCPWRHTEASVTSDARPPHQDPHTCTTVCTPSQGEPRKAPSVFLAAGLLRVFGLWILTLSISGWASRWGCVLAECQFLLLWDQKKKML